MGNNGQQLMGCLPLGSTKVRVVGANQSAAVVQWNGVAGNAWCQGMIQDPKSVGPAPQSTGFSSWGFTTNDWWWKGNVQIWWDDSAGKTHAFQASVPVNAPAANPPLSGVIPDWWIVFSAEWEANPNIGGGLPIDVKHSLSAPGLQHEEKPRHGMH